MASVPTKTCPREPASTASGAHSATRPSTSPAFARATKTWPRSSGLEARSCGLWLCMRSFPDMRLAWRVEAPSRVRSKSSLGEYLARVWLGNAGTAHGDRQHGPEPGRVVLQAQRAAVHAGDGGDQAEAQTGAGAGAALLQAHEALQGALAVLRRNARAPIRHRDLDGVADTAEGDGDLWRRDRRRRWRATGRHAHVGCRGILDGVVHEVGDGLAHQLAVGHRAQPRLRRDGKAEPGLLGNGLVEFGNVADQIGQVDGSHALGGSAGLKAGNQEQRVEGLDQLVSLLD